MLLVPELANQRMIRALIRPHQAAIVIGADANNPLDFGDLPKLRLLALNARREWHHNGACVQHRQQRGNRCRREISLDGDDGAPPEARSNEFPFPVGQRSKKVIETEGEVLPHHRLAPAKALQPVNKRTANRHMPPR